MATSGPPTFKKADFVEKYKAKYPTASDEEAAAAYKASGSMLYGMPRSGIAERMEAATILTSMKFPKTDSDLEGLKGVYTKGEDLVATSVALLFSKTASTGGRRRARRMHGGGIGDALVRLYTVVKDTAKSGVEKLTNDIESTLDSISAKIADEGNAPKVAYGIKTAFRIIGSGLVVNDIRSGTSGVIGSVVAGLCRALEYASPGALAPIEALIGASEILRTMGQTAIGLTPTVLAAYVVARIASDAYSAARGAASGVDTTRADTYYGMLRDYMTGKLAAGGRELYAIVDYNMRGGDDQQLELQLVAARSVLDLPRDDPRRRAAIAGIRDSPPLPSGDGGGGASSSAMDTGGRRRTKKHRRARRHHRKTLKRV